MAATITKSKSGRVGVDLLERLDFAESNVDRTACVIRNVKILGRTSPNRHGMDVEGTDYLPSAHAQVRNLYEGMAVNMGHPPRSDPDAERNPEDRNGVLFNIVTREGQTYGNWKLIPSHPMTRRLLECAADPQLHGQFALSHNAKGFGVVRENRYQISEIPRVRSVDLVCRGGTNTSLFEGRESMKKKFRTVLESAREKTRERFRPLIDLYEEIGDMPADPIAPPAPDLPEAEADSKDYMSHLGEMVKAILLDGSMDVAQKCDKIMAAIKVMEEEESGGDLEIEGGEGEGDEGDGESMESRERAELIQLRGEKAVRDLCESLEFSPSAIQLRAMVPLNDADRRAFVKELKGKPAAKDRSTPRTATSRSVGRGADVRESRLDFSDDTEAGRSKRLSYLKS